MSHTMCTGPTRYKRDLALKGHILSYGHQHCHMKTHRLCFNVSHSKLSYVRSPAVTNAITAGLSGVIAFLNSFSFTTGDIDYLRTVLPHCEDEFFTWLGELDCRDVQIYALEEGTLCFPRVPLIRVEVSTHFFRRQYPSTWTKLYELNTATFVCVTAVHCSIYVM